MIWSKTKQLLESFLDPSLKGRVEYSATGYRYLPDKAGLCYITVDKKKVFNMSDNTTGVRWYETEQEIKNDQNIQIPISNDEIEAVRKDSKGTIPEERLEVIARNRKIVNYAKDLMAAQIALSKSNFSIVANKFLSTSIEESLKSDDILLNVFALVDRRIGKKRLLSMGETIKLKHPIVQYFHELRLSK